MVTRVDFFYQVSVCYGIVLMFISVLTGIQRRMHGIAGAALSACCDLGWVLSFSSRFSVFSSVFCNRHAFLLLGRRANHAQKVRVNAAGAHAARSRTEPSFSPSATRKSSLRGFVGE